ncbi:hypothetical protein TRFO_29497 [Tritrichomonas foetus]|uniref:BRCT domain-containing protein n=1 Tax=Tritrichomonas foetus TaxID=1144522 RepID=A0A1J4JVN7_9EUKA|nr:hypothetical protein TRFO_29497 [Tritrichomonas foetus]|eukprot:OHT03191.1 hypothetical protein TRFO_29497 [Tritrichomonas foetus]
MVFAIERQCKLISPLRDCIEANGGKIGNNPTHIIVTNGFGKSFPNIITITSYWIWYCSENQSIVSDFKPLKFKTPLERIHNMIFCLHGIDEKQRWILSDMIRIVGGSVNNKFNKNMRLLVANEYNEMFEKMKVTVVSTNFVYKMVNTGELPDPSHYKLKQTSKEESLSLKGDIDFGKLCYNIIMNIKSSENSSIKYVGKQLTDSYLEKLESFSPDFPSSPKPVREFVVT